MKFARTVPVNLRLLLALLCLATYLPAAQAAPPDWADKKLPVTDGLQLWLDASSMAEKKEFANGKPVGEWRDASGHDRTVKQKEVKKQPKLIKKGKTALLRFDGVDDHFHAEKLLVKFKRFTIIAELVPRSSKGSYPAIFSANEHGSNDYSSGINIDFGGNPAREFSFLNIEGRGFGGVKNYRTEKSDFGKLQVIEAMTVSDSKKLQVTIDGKVEGDCPQEDKSVSFDEITIGARFYSNDSPEPRAQGFGQSDMAEILIYDRELSEDELKKVRGYLSEKYAKLKDDLPPAEQAANLLVPIKDPPPVQVFAPGFSVRELPIELSNVNNIKYRSDGVLVALAYNGDIWLLRDTNNDGLEDKADLFWKNDGKTTAPIGFDLTPPDYKLGSGVFVASKGKIALIADIDHDDKADKEIIIADGWQELPHGVDALGVAFDPKSNMLYYGMGTATFTDAYAVAGKDKAGYSLASERGTIMQVDVETHKRSIIATGIRFPVGLRLNHLSDLFCSDQEGATWLANGNPFDELLHIQWNHATGKTRHYGFPPRHPRHLPGVIDEPSTFDYGPQHQSLCGFNFNEPVKADGPTFGPAAWLHDVFVTGFSRGKIYRTELVRSEKTQQYTARTSLFASLNMLTVDNCVSPAGDLIVACHEGGPDWGKGPTGKGKLYNIKYIDKEHPQPVFAWPAGRNEVRVEFDRPVDPMLLTDLVKNSKLTVGKWVRAGDRFEALWPGYAVVLSEKSTPRFDVAIRSAQLTADRRTLVLATDAHDAAAHYGLQLAGMGRPTQDHLPTGTMRQEPQIDLDFDLTGCEATWKSDDGKTEWRGWLPHIDLQVAREFTSGSVIHDQLWYAMAQPGVLTIRTQLDLVDMLRPALQPGTKIDYEFPAEKVTLEFAGFESEIKITVAEGKPEIRQAPHTTLTLDPQKGQLIPIEIQIKTKQVPRLSIMYRTAEQSDVARTVALRRFLVPWAQTNIDALDAPPAPTKIPELDGGSWARGRKVFYSDQANCSKCHTLHGSGGNVGPDLSNLIHRDYPSVLRDITQPSFAINPDHLSYVVETNDGRELTGVLKSHGDKFQLANSKGEIIELAADDISTKHPSATSVMPEGIPKLLGEEKMRDLLTFLLTPAPHMPREEVAEFLRPRPRTMSEVKAILSGAPTPAGKPRHLRVVLVDGVKDHGISEHDYPAWSKMWSELMAAGDAVDVVTARDWPEKKEFEKADAMVFYQRGDWNKERAADIDAFLARGGGLVYIHWAVDGRKEAPEFAKRIGLAWHGASKFRHGPLDLVFNQDSKHPVARNFDTLSFVDESYWDLTGEMPAGRVIGSGMEGNKLRPLFWSVEHGKGRVFVSIPGHFSWTFDDPLFRTLLLRGIAWGRSEPVDRFNELVLPGADVQK